MNNVEKIESGCEKIFVEKAGDFSFPYKSTFFGRVFQRKTTRKSTRFFCDFSLLMNGFTHFPHSLLLLLLNI